jgi:hypothetical protein
MLSTHLQGRYRLSERIEPLEGTRHDIMRGCALRIEKLLQSRLQVDLLNRLYIFTGGLRKPGSAKPDARERYLVAKQPPEVTKEAA